MESNKPGVQTTEVWAVAVSGVAGLVTAFAAEDVATRVTALICFTALIVTYTVCRSWVKVAGK